MPVGQNLLFEGFASKQLAHIDFLRGELIASLLTHMPHPNSTRCKPHSRGSMLAPILKAAAPKPEAQLPAENMATRASLVAAAACSLPATMA